MLFSLWTLWRFSHLPNELSTTNCYTHTYLCLYDCVQNTHNSVYAYVFTTPTPHHRYFCCCCCCHYFENERRFLMLPLFLFLSLLSIVTRAHTNGWQFFYTHEINSHFSLNLVYWKLSMYDSSLICRREIRYFFLSTMLCKMYTHTQTHTLCLISNDCIVYT